MKTELVKLSARRKKKLIAESKAKLLIDCGNTTNLP